MTRVQWQIFADKMCAKKQASGEEWHEYQPNSHTYDQAGEKVEKPLQFSTFPSVMFAFHLTKKYGNFFEGIKTPSCFGQHINTQLRPELEYDMTKTHPNMLCETLCVEKGGRTGQGCEHQGAFK